MYPVKENRQTILGLEPGETVTIQGTDTTTGEQVYVHVTMTKHITVHGTKLRGCAVMTARLPGGSPYATIVDVNLRINQQWSCSMNGRALTITVENYSLVEV